MSYKITYYNILKLYTEPLFENILWRGTNQINCSAIDKRIIATLITLLTIGLSWSASDYVYAVPKYIFNVITSSYYI